MKKAYSLLVVLCLLLSGCAQTSEPIKYAELRLSKENRIQVLIRSKRWMGLVNPEDGIAAYNSYSTYCWSTLDGTKSEYVNPPFNITSTVQYKHRGTIKVDRKGKSVVIALERLVSKPDETERWETSPHNGTFYINEVNYEPFQTPE